RHPADAAVTRDHPAPGVPRGRARRRAGRRGRLGPGGSRPARRPGRRLDPGAVAQAPGLVDRAVGRGVRAPARARLAGRAGALHRAGRRGARPRRAADRPARAAAVGAPRRAGLRPAARAGPSVVLGRRRRRRHRDQV
ncbi:MAG: hypothetical protein AVDCRST_MAG16-319, partial [uncultured Frankineae bacterium]